MKSRDILLETAEVLESTLDKIDRLKVLSEKEKEAVKTKLKNAAANFKKLAEEAEKDNEELAEFFLKKAKELKLASVDKKIEEMGKKEYLKLVNRIELYSRSAEYDFKPEKLAELKRVYRKYIFGMTSFFILTGIYLNQFLAVTALILAIPIILDAVPPEEGLPRASAGIFSHTNTADSRRNGGKLRNQGPQRSSKDRGDSGTP